MTHLLLFDIDGTLISGGPAKSAFHDGLMAAYGTVGDIEVLDFSGKTDPQIARELLSGAGLSHAEIDAGLPTLFSHYLREMEARLPEHPVRVLPGVTELLAHLAELEEVALGLVTGNHVGGARLKLQAPGLADHFHFPVGGYGSDSEHRNDLPGIALDRAREHWDVDFDPARVVVIGDTPRDVECGRAHGLATVAVATGKFAAGALRSTGADHVLEDFTDLEETASRLLGQAA